MTKESEDARKELAVVTAEGSKVVREALVVASLTGRRRRGGLGLGVHLGFI